jgi:hypothetical protein
MKGMWRQSESLQLFVGDFDGGIVAVGVQGRSDDQAGLGGRAGDQAHDRLVAHRGPPAPVGSFTTVHELALSFWAGFDRDPNDPFDPPDLYVPLDRSFTVTVVPEPSAYDDRNPQR